MIKVTSTHSKPGRNVEWLNPYHIIRIRPASPDAAEKSVIDITENGYGRTIYTDETPEEIVVLIDGLHNSIFDETCTRPKHAESPCNGLPRPDCPGYQNWLMEGTMADDVTNMHEKFGFHDSIVGFTNHEWRQLLKFRIDFQKEETKELVDAYEAKKPEDIVDALIDGIVVALGTLDLFSVNTSEAWNKVHKANMSKERGIKPERPNPLGFPDLIKPAGWKAPSHKGNVGMLPAAVS